MGAKQVEVWSCDVCGYNSTQFQSKPTPGWVKISIDDPHLDRSWYTKTICPHCVELIDSARKNREFWDERVEKLEEVILKLSKCPPEKKLSRTEQKIVKEIRDKNG